MGLDLRPVSEVRKELNSLLNGALDHPVYVTQHGRVSGVLLSYSVFERMVDRIEDSLDLRDPEIIEEIARTETALEDVDAAYASGELMPLAEFEAELAEDDAVQHRDIEGGPEAD